MSKKRKKDAPKNIILNQIIGKTIKELEWGIVDIKDGPPNPIIYLIFTDNTRHGFVLPADY